MLFFNSLLSLPLIISRQHSVATSKVEVPTSFLIRTAYDNDSELRSEEAL